MNGLGKPFRKKFDRKKTAKIKVNLLHVKKTLAKKQLFVQTPFFLHYCERTSSHKTNHFFAALSVSA